MEKLIPLINEIHDVLSKSQLSNQLRLPQIVVIGSQSTGKSSLLESIVGQEILPRGKGIVTRRPIEIQLKNQPNAEQDYVEFSERRGEKITDMDQVRKMIDEDTEKIAGKNKAISNVPLRIKFYSKNVVDLILVDLPGMTKNPVGDQPQDIEQQILNLIEPYIKNPNSIIMAVSKGSDDLANSESLKLSRKIDPQGNRTIGVITQLDLIDEGADVLNDLQNKTYPLKLGYVGVTMRGQKDIKIKTIKEQIADEKAYFENHSIYRHVSNKMGIPYLIKLLNLSLMNHIKKTLPNIRENIVQMLSDRENDLKQYGDYSSLEDKKDRGIFVLRLISQFTKSYNSLILGHYIQANNDELQGGSRIQYIFNNIFRKSITEINPFDILKDEDIRTAIKNADGLKQSLFVAEGAFENLVKQQISRLLNPSIQCSHLVYEELRRIINLINVPEIQRFDNFNNRIFQVMEDVLERSLKPTDQMIKNLIEIELGYINTNHPDFIGGIELVQNQSEQMCKEEEQKRNQQKSQAGQYANKNERGQESDSDAKSAISNKSQAIGGIEKNQKKQQSQNVQATSSTPTEQEDSSFWSWLPFSSKQNKQTELLDNKLKIMNMKKLAEENQGKDFSDSYSQNSPKGYTRRIYREFMAPQSYNDDYSINNINQGYQGNLPQVPTNIRLEDKPSKREMSESEMIKNLIVSYFNIVKKSVNDSVPKTIVSFLVNRSVNIAERELVSNLYKEDIFDDLLAENSYIAKQREEIKAQMILLRSCLNVLNDLDAKF
ncbi:hypothetical protein ABPG72_000847 [Tetrahymena utriculariae]